MARHIPPNLDQIYYLQTKLGDSLDAEAIERGWAIHAGRRVDRIKYLNGEATSRLLDKLFYDTVIDFVQFSDSRCSCGGAACAHMAALFFDMVRDAGLSPEICRQFLLDAAETVLPQQAQPEDHMDASAKTKTAAAKNEKPAKKKIKPRAAPDRAPVLSEGAGFEDWHKQMELMYEKGRRLQNDLDALALLLRLEFELLPICASWDAGKRDLFQIYAYLFFLRKLDEEYAALLEKVEHWRLQIYLEAWSEGFHQIMGVLEDSELTLLGESRYKSYADGIAKALHDGLMSKGEKPFDWLHLYILLWGGVLQHEIVQHKELNRLNRLAEEVSAEDSRRDSALWALAHFAVLQEKDAVAFELMNRASVPPQLSHVIIYLNTFEAWGEQSRLAKWLVHALPSAAVAPPYELGKYLAMWERVHRKLKLTDQYADVLRRLLPRSAHEYGKMLFRQKRYREWADLQMATGNDLADMDLQKWKAVLRADAGAMLPLLHRGFGMFVARKNKEGYRKAVKCLLMLRECYMQLKRPDRWKEFLEVVRQRHSRLRSLQDMIAREVPGE